MIVLPWVVATTAALTLFAIYRLEGFIMSEVQNAVDAIVAQLVRASDEIKAQIASLEAREPSVDIAALKNAAQALDDVVPDVPVVPAPVEDVPVVDVPPAE